MDIMRGILDGIAIAAIFNGIVATLVLINPRLFFDSYPKAIQKAAPAPMTKQEKKINKILTIIIVGICFTYSIISLLHSSVAGFWSIFWMGYIQWSILNAGDFERERGGRQRGDDRGGHIGLDLNHIWREFCEIDGL